MTNNTNFDLAFLDYISEKVKEKNQEYLTTNKKLFNKIIKEQKKSLTTQGSNNIKNIEKIFENLTDREKIVGHKIIYEITNALYNNQEDPAFESLKTFKKRLDKL
jgi:hypothetical protein